MARFWFGDSDDWSLGIGLGGDLKRVAATRKYYTDEVGGTQHTDLLIAGDTPATEVVGSGLPVRFQGPDGVLSMWESANDGPRVLVMSTDVPQVVADAVDGVVDSVSTLMSTVADDEESDFRATLDTVVDASADDRIAAHAGTSWTAATSYKRGRVVVNPSGVVVVANVDHTSAAAYATDTAKWTTASVIYALAPANKKRPVGQDEIFINVKDYGAVGDGTTDDTAAIAAAYAATGWPARPATLYFPAPTSSYLVTAGLTVNGGGATSTPMLKILGHSAKISCATAGVKIFDITNSVVSLTHVKVSGFLFLINGAMTGIRLNNAEMCDISENSFVGSFATAIKIEGVSTYNTIAKNDFSSVARGIYLPGNVSGLTIRDNHFAEQVSGSPLNWIQADTTDSNSVKIVGNTFYGTGCTLPAVNIMLGNSWVISHNTFWRSDDIGIYVYSDGNSRLHTIANNTFIDSAKDDIKIDGGRGCTIAHNVHGTRRAGTTASTYAAVRVVNKFGGAAGSDTTLVGNVSLDTGTALQASFMADANCLGVMAIGNVFKVAQSFPGTTHTVIGAAGTRLPASVAAAASLSLPHGVAPTSPVNGDMWTTTAGLFVRVNGTTVGPLS